MKKYLVTLSGRGAEVYIHKIDEEQKKTLQEMDIEDKDQSVDWDKLNETLKVENWDYADVSYTGAYPSPTSSYLAVMDDQDEIVWESDEDYELSPMNDEDYKMVYEKDVLLIEHYVKGSFATYAFETENFEPEKLAPILTEINETVELITGMTYDGQQLEVEEWGDNWSKGAFFYIF